MSDSSTECDDSSGDELTPIMESKYHSTARSHESVVPMTYLQNLSQLDEMLPPLSHCSKKEVAILPSKRAYLVVPPPVVATLKAAVKPPISDEDLRLEVIRIMELLPRGEVSMWGIMQTIEFNDMRYLCKYRGLNHGRASKSEMGQRIFKCIKNGEFNSIFKAIEEQKKGGKCLTGKGTAQPQLGKRSATNMKETREVIARMTEIGGSKNAVTIDQNEILQLRDVESSEPVTPHRAVPIPVVAVGGIRNWKVVDNRKLLMMIG